MRLRLDWVSGIVLAMAIGLSAGCTTVPETGRKQVVLISAGEEMQLGLSEFEKIKKSTPVSSDPAHNNLVKSVGGKIAGVAPVPNAKWEFVVFDKPDTPNAFALPGGKVGIYSGILPITKNEAGLATVMAHEVAHVVARHGGERISEGLLVQLGGLALSQAYNTKPEATQALINAAYGVGSTVAVMLPHSRRQELEADQLGLIYMARAGYNPREAVDFWKRFSQHKGGGGGKNIAFLSTHPLDEERIKQLESLLPQAEAEYKKAGGR